MGLILDSSHFQLIPGLSVIRLGRGSFDTSRTADDWRSTPVSFPLRTLVTSNLALQFKSCNYGRGRDSWVNPNCPRPKFFVA